MSQKKQTSGGARLMASGKRPVLLGFSKASHEKISTAAAAEGRPVTQFVMHHAVMAAEKILKKLANSP